MATGVGTKLVGEESGLPRTLRALGRRWGLGSWNTRTWMGPNSVPTGSRALASGAAPGARWPHLCSGDDPRVPRGSDTARGQT